MSIDVPESLLTHIQKGRCSLFLGAGASMGAGFPSATDLAKFLVSRAGSIPGLSADQPLDMVAQLIYLQPGYGSQWVRQEIIEYLESFHRTVPRPPSEAHRLMTTLPWRTIFTTNYDRLIEIAYDSSIDAVQRCLPIYTPDPLILRHDADVVRVIKLNGSVDEASRNRNHRLVLTFAEQQDAKSENSDFYRLLREEAINGPIIFVGFRFSHPGSYAPATSPEFTELRMLLQELGPSAQWHYSVSPFDKEDPALRPMLALLSASQISAINVDFSNFVSTVSTRLSKPRTPIRSRTAVQVPVGRRVLSISADEYQADLRHFEILTSQIEELLTPKVAESLNGNDNWASYLNNHFIERASAGGLRETIVSAATSSTAELVTLVAPPGWGKTTVLKQLAVEFYRTGRPVIWLNPMSTLEIYDAKGRSIIVGSWDLTRIEAILHLLSNLEGTDSSTIPCLIADDCAERSNEVISLFRNLVKNRRRFVLALALRDDEYAELKESHPLVRKSRRYEPEGLSEPRAEVQKLIDFCADNGVATFKDEAQRHIVGTRIIEEEASASLLLALQVIFDHEHRPFSEIVREIWDSLQNETSKLLFLRVSTWHRFGNSFQPRLYSILQSFPALQHRILLDSYREYARRGLLSERDEEGEPCVATLHSLWAAKLVQVAGIEPAAFDDELLAVLRQMSRNIHDLELIRRLLKKVTDYKVSLSSEEKTQELFLASAEATSDDWVVCHQFSNYLLQRAEFDLAFSWMDRALAKNRDHPPLHHTKGNILRRWGIALLLDGKAKEAEMKFEAARSSFAISRVRRDADEFGYVTHLDMLLYLISKASDETRKANLISEGIQLFQKGMRAVPEDRFNYLLDERFKTFDLSGSALQELCTKIEKAMARGGVSSYAAVFLARQAVKQGKYAEAIKILQLQRTFSPNGLLLWVAEAEINAREGRFVEATKSIDSGRRQESFAENPEVVWDLVYWDLLVSFVVSDYGKCRAAAIRIATGASDISTFPKGYIWKSAARRLAPEKRTFLSDAIIYQGRVGDVRSGGHYGEIEMSNSAGEKFRVKFNPRYWTRSHRRGDFVKFAITILPLGIRAEDPASKPFLRTVDDLFVQS